MASSTIFEPAYVLALYRTGAARRLLGVTFSLRTWLVDRARSIFVDLVFVGFVRVSRYEVLEFLDLRNQLFAGEYRVKRLG